MAAAAPAQQRSPRAAHGKAQYTKKAPGSLSNISLPRYHPATYTSPAASSVTSPESTFLSPENGPLSPRSQVNARHEAQRRLAVYQAEFHAFKQQQASSPGMRPASPTLNPSLSPCPVTPLELEQDREDYLLAGARELGERDKEDLVRRMIAAETGRPASRAERAKGAAS